MKKILTCVIVCFLVLGIVPNVYAETLYKIQGKEISYDRVEWPGEGGCWEYANEIYSLIWGEEFDSSFCGNNESGNNLLQKLSDDERLFTIENTELFIKSAVPGAVIRIMNGKSDSPTFESDGLQIDGTYGHNIIIVAIYDEGFIAFESLPSGTRERFYTWKSFYDSWSAVGFSGQSRYMYYKYIKWPSAPVLLLNESKQNIPDWTGFILLCLAGALFMLLVTFVVQQKHIIVSVEREKLFAKIIAVGTPLCMGLFFVWSSALFCIILIFVLLFAIYQKGPLQINFNEQLLATALLPIAYGITSIWAVDHGLAVMGIVKFLPIPLFVLVLQQYDHEVKKEILNTVPWSAAIMTILSAVLAMLPVTNKYTIVDGRLAGFFQYPNAFALFLLLAMIILSYQRFKIKELIMFVILFCGLLATGSRTVFVLALPIAILRMVTLSDQKKRWIAFALVFTVIAAVIGMATLIPNSPMGRVLAISLKSSTFLGRFLYFRDAVLQILRTPFGMGFLGYYYSQGSFQSGVYSVMFVHNEFLQLLLDIGWVPALIVILFLIRSLFCKKITWLSRLIILAILSHSQFDFSMQFIVIWCILACCVDGGHVFFKTDLRGRVPVAVVSSMIAALCIAFGVANFLETYGTTDAALWAYPNNTAVLCTKLTEVSDPDAMECLADKILDLDDNVSVAYSAKAAVAFGKGKITEMIINKEAAIACAVYDQEEYRDYFTKLQQSADLYERQGDQQSRQFCIDKIKMIPEMMRIVLEKTSPLAWEINDVPVLELSEEQNKYLDSLVK